MYMYMYTYVYICMPSPIMSPAPPACAPRSNRLCRLGPRAFWDKCWKFSMSSMVHCMLRMLHV